jgi:[acyl-carrier-protein] S-malonyltransferase
VKRLPVNGAFHTPLMQPAIDPFKAALRKVQVQDPLVYVHSNTDGKYYRDASHIRRQLPSQIVKPVKWEQTLHNLYERPEGENFPRTFECGPGKSLKTILKQVNLKASETTHSYSS